MNKIVIGLVGEIGGGKETFTKLLKEKYKDGVAMVRFSDILGDTLNLWGLERSRENYQKLSVAMRNTFGDGTLTNAVYHRVQNLNSEIVILDGVRWLSDADLVRKFPSNILVYVTADAKIRYQRTKDRKEKAGESQDTWEDFQKKDQAETEKDVPTIGAWADFKIDNNGTLEDYRRQVAEFCDRYLKS